MYFFIIKLISFYVCDTNKFSLIHYLLDFVSTNAAHFVDVLIKMVTSSIYLCVLTKNSFQYFLEFTYDKKFQRVTLNRLNGFKERHKLTSKQIPPNKRKEN